MLYIDDDVLHILAVNQLLTEIDCLRSETLARAITFGYALC